MKMQKKLKRLLFLVHVPFHFLKFDKKKAIGEKSNVNRKRNSGLNKFQIKKINQRTNTKARPAAVFQSPQSFHNTIADGGGRGMRVLFRFFLHFFFGLQCCGSSVAAAEEAVELGLVATARVDAGRVGLQLARLFQRDAQTLGAHGRSAGLATVVPAK